MLRAGHSLGQTGHERNAAAKDPWEQWLCVLGVWVWLVIPWRVVVGSICWLAQGHVGIFKRNDRERGGRGRLVLAQTISRS